MKAPESESAPKPTSRVLATIKYALPSDLRTNYLTRLYAAPTPDGQVNIVGYVERQGFPERATVTELAEGGGILEDEGGGGWVREIQNSFIISIASAENLVEVLQEAITDIKSRKSSVAKAKSKKN